MSKQYVAKPLKVDAFQYGKDVSPLWFLTAIRKRQIKLMPSRGHIVAKTEAGKINFYDPITFNALFETVESATDLNKDGTVDTREKAIASETKAKRKRKPKKEEVPVEPEVTED